MRRLSAYVFAALAAVWLATELQPVLSQETGRQNGRRWAILIGVEKYDRVEIPQLRFCVDDVKLLHQTLTGSCGYNASDVLLLHSETADADQLPTLENLRTWVRFILKRIQAEDTVLVFFSGHGVLGPDGGGFLLPANVDAARLSESALATSELRSMLAGCSARQKLLVLDCCHAGGKGLIVEERPLSIPGSEEIGRQFRAVENLLTLASCQAREVSYEWPEQQQGLFTYFLSRGLSGDADGGVDGVVNTAELYSYLRDSVTHAARTKLNVTQTPVQIVPPGEVPVFDIATVEKKGFLEDFSRAKPELLPEGWSGNGLTVQTLGGQNVLQMRDIGTGVAVLPKQKIQDDFFLECAFHTRGYVNKPRAIEVLLEDRNRRPLIHAVVLDQYPNLDVTINGKSMRGNPLGGSSPHRLVLERSGQSLQVKLDGVAIGAFKTTVVPIPTVRVSLRNDRDEYGRADTEKFPTIYSVRIGPLESSE